jgi:hypothetical protein
VLVATLKSKLRAICVAKLSVKLRSFWCKIEWIWFRVLLRSSAPADSPWRVEGFEKKLADTYAEGVATLHDVLRRSAKVYKDRPAQVLVSSKSPWCARLW